MSLEYANGGAMYTVPDVSSVTNEMLDWRQLGILLTFCHRKLGIKKYHKLKPYKESLPDPYIRDLLKGNALTYIIIN